MSIENFRIIKEIFSLKSKQNQLVILNNEDSSRIQKIQKSKSNKMAEYQEYLTQLDLCQVNIKKLETENNDLIAQLANKKSQFDQIKDQNTLIALEKDISNLTQKNNLIEEEIFKLIEENEQLQIEIKDAEDYLKNIEKSLEEINQEVLAKNSEHMKEFDILENRIKLLIPQLGDKYTLVFNKLDQLKHPISSFTRLQNLSCEFCGMSFERPLLHELDVLFYPFQCKGCKRLIMPSIV